MSSLANQSPSHLTTYHENNGLILQFILAELIEAASIRNDMEQIVEKMTGKSRKKMVELQEFLTTLCGSSQGYMRIFTWNLSDGILTKMKNYCSFFIDNNDHIDAALIRAADRTWHLALQSLDLIRAVLQQKKRTAEDIHSIVDSLATMSQSLDRTAKLVSQIIPEFRDDENVILYLVRHKKHLDEVYGEGFGQKLLDKMFPKGKKGIEQFLFRRYAKRGFDISHHLAELWN